MRKIKAAILGPGNIGTDLMYKIHRSEKLEMDTMVGIYPESEGLARAREKGYNASAEGIESIIDNPQIKIVFDATGAKPHLKHAPMLKKAGKIGIDLTPAAVGPYTVPTVNFEEHIDEDNVNLITCGGQATIPIVAAINEVADVEYGEIVATISSRSAGPGTRQNIDEFTQTTARGLEVVGGANEGKAIIIVNPADPAITMRNTIYTRVKNPDENKINEAIKEMEKKVQEYVPGYKVTVGPIIEDKKVTTMIEVEGAGDYFPKYAGNYDIINAAATALGEKFAEKLLKEAKKDD